jgi:AcrR family transcriptional regulator
MASTREKILKASTVLFARAGYSGTSTFAIAKRARVAETSIYRQFGSKSNLFIEVVRQVLHNRPPRPFPDPLPGDLDKSLEKLMAWGNKVADPTVQRLLYFAVLENQKEALDLVVEFTRGVYAGLAQYFTRVGVEPAGASYVILALWYYDRFLRWMFDNGEVVIPGIPREFENRVLWALSLVSAGLHSSPPAASDRVDQAVGSSASSTSIETGIGRPGVVP